RDAGTATSRRIGTDRRRGNTDRERRLTAFAVRLSAQCTRSLNQHVVGFYEPRLRIFADREDRRAGTIRRDGRAVEMDLLSRPRYSKWLTHRVAAIAGERESLSGVQRCLERRGVIDAIGRRKRSGIPRIEDH